MGLVQELAKDLGARWVAATGKPLLFPLPPSAQTQDSGFLGYLTWVPKASVRRLSTD